LQKLIYAILREVFWVFRQTAVMRQLKRQRNKNRKMNKILTLLFIGLTTLTYGQKSKGPNFDIADFNKKMEVAEWLYEYDVSS
jgi:hypothetical protein